MLSKDSATQDKKSQGQRFSSIVNCFILSLGFYWVLCHDRQIHHYRVVERHSPRCEGHSGLKGDVRALFHLLLPCYVLSLQHPLYGHDGQSWQCSSWPRPMGQQLHFLFFSNFHEKNGSSTSNSLQSSTSFEPGWESVCVCVCLNFFKSLA